MSIGTVGTAGVERSFAAMPDRWRRERRFHSGMAVLMAATVLAGFARTYYLKGFFGTPVLPSLYHVHGLLFTCWIVLLVVQTTLVAARRTDLHRRLGLAGAVLVVMMFATGVAAGIDMGRRGAAPAGVPPLVFMVVPLAGMVIFPALIGTALLLRRQPDAHKRLMLIGTAELVTAAVGRLPVISALGPLAFFGLTDLLLVAMLVHDRRTLGRFHRATVSGGLFLVLSQPGRLLLAQTDTWQALARWLVG
jgi:hypothetical protein